MTDSQVNMVRVLGYCRGWLTLAVVLPVALAPATCLGWNESGHKAIGLLVYRQLSAEQRAQMVALLREHPCFERHFLGCMPDEVWQGSDSDKDEWIFAHAGHWPDLVRSESNVVTARESEKYDRAAWHFLDLPIFLRPSDGTALLSGLPRNPLMDGTAGQDRLEYNVVQAINYNLSAYRRGETKSSDRAVCLCWLLHLVADLHQPCHAASLFSVQQFPQGDRGAGELQVRRDQTLHGLWDAAIVDRADFVIARAKAKRLAPLLESPEKELIVASSPEQWLRESHELARRFVYTQEVRDAVLAWEESGKRGVLTLSPDYVAQARRIANERAVLAARRLATLLRSSGDGEGLPGESPPPESR